MAEYTLVSAPPLAGTDLRFGDSRVTAPADLAIVSMAVPLGGDEAAHKAVTSAFGMGLPEPGKSVLTEDGEVRLMRLALDQAFVLFTHADPDAERVIAGKLGGALYTTDQTDVWCALEVSGPTCRAALERICPIDIHPDAFAVNALARTMMEHLGTIIIRTDSDSFLLLSGSSSAQSFLHAVETSFRNVM
ncbi:sarcosine oxidase subunit gamma [Roseovarius sp. SCSIO 43702]|uniref:sarcosine oxidase subunit gamma n=1 Tax=Roseovarius sp. SCSIO 43702 TaxID=2823043 RepID=UPI001C73DDC0|nr:sarcosine oxidase subunit gamma [Roseovarius sp. SCSIO 43702]QYX57521.1 sarcosine oxidase subunit gamma [Roseovarius sp. SCSIO 43702]